MVHLDHWCFKPLHPKINKHILHTVPHTFLRYWQGEFVKQSGPALVGDDFLLFLWPWYLIQGWYCEEKLDASHFRGLKGWPKYFRDQKYGIAHIQHIFIHGKWGICWSLKPSAYLTSIVVKKLVALNFQEIENLTLDLEVCQQQLQSKYGAVKIIQSLSRLEQAHQKQCSRKALEASKKLEQVNLQK